METRLLIKRKLFCSQQATNVATINGGSTQQPSNEINKTSGGITIVKLNAPPPIPLHQPPLIEGQSATGTPATVLRTAAHQHQNYVQQQNHGPPPPPAKLMNGTSHQRPTTPSQITTTGGHVVTIHTSSITSAAATLAAAHNQQSTVTTAGTVAPVVSPPHTGYTRRAKLGDSRSTGRLHSAGNTHRSMTRLNIAGKFKKMKLK